MTACCFQSSGVLPADGDPIACHSHDHDVCVVTPDGRHHTYDRWHPERGVRVTLGCLHPRDWRTQDVDAERIDCSACGAIGVR